MRWLVLLLALVSAQTAHAATELCAPFPVSGGAASNVVNPATGIVYTLDGRGCASFNDLDVPYFLTQGYTAPGSSTAGARIRLTGSLNLYADFVAGNDANACTMAAPCKTAQATYNRAVVTYDTAGQLVSIHLVNNDPTCLQVSVPWVGGGQFAIVGPGAANAQPTIGFVGCAGSGVYVNTTLPNYLYLINLAVSSGGNSYSVDNYGVGEVVLSNVAFGTAGQGHIHALGAGAQFTCAQPNILTMTAGAPTGFWIAVEAAGAFFCANSKLVFLGAQTYAATAVASATAVIWMHGTSFCSAYGATTCPAVTAVSGFRYDVVQNGVIDTGTSNINFIPGSTPGILTNGGVYN